VNRSTAMSAQLQTTVKPERGRAARLGFGLAVCVLALTAAGCKGGQQPAGQVVATVNGKEITAQDLMAEARAAGVRGHADPRPLLQRVIARVLLAQYAHDKKLDAYPGYPSDMLRMQQDFLARRALSSVIKAPPPPSASDIAAFEAARPFAFAQRTRLQVDEIRFQTSDNLKSVMGANDMPGLVSRLKGLNTPFQRQTRTLDTAELPSGMVTQIVATPNGKLMLIREGDGVVGMVIQQRDPLVLPQDQQDAIAAQIIGRAAIQRQGDAEVASLRNAAKITYQPGFAPQPASGAPPAASGAPPAGSGAPPAQ
jgi:peptidyl-prolyl cis-trans isomerase C